MHKCTHKTGQKYCKTLIRLEAKEEIFYNCWLGRLFQERRKSLKPAEYLGLFDYQEFKQSFEA